MHARLGCPELLPVIHDRAQTWDSLNGAFELAESLTAN